uniref:Calx-beta domain-containing protein n=1 Tax=Amphimedon queenslandica TaxID=400682 RepID=A0A1X7TNI5_AMPQE
MALVLLDLFPFFLLLLAAPVQGQLQEGVTVQCYSSAADCTSNTNGVSLAAIDCCNRTGGGYISHSSLAAAQQCGACVVVGFDQSCVHIGPSDAGRRYSFTADVLLSTPGAPDVTDLDYVISRESAMLVDVADYLSSDFAGRTNSFLPERFSIRYLSQGNAVALQPTLSFDYLIAVETDPGDPAIPSGVVLVYRRLSITIEDIDIITVGLEPPSVFLEGINAVAVIGRQVITYESPFEVTVSLERYTGPLSHDEAAVGDFDLFDFTEQRSVVFHPATAIDQCFEHVTFFMPRDNIVELQEVFRWRLSVNDSRVRLDPDKTTQIVRVDNQDVFSIGFKSLNVTIREGEVASLTIKQIGDEKGGIDIGGFPESRIYSVQVKHKSGTATNGSDYSLNSVVPRLTYSVNNALNDIPFTPITSIDDNIIEGNETIRVIILPVGDNVVQVRRDRQTATITIIDDDTGVLSLERGTYDMIENEGTVEICAVLTGGVLSTDTEIILQARDNTARFRKAEVRFAIGQATFSEGGGNQSITVILGGGQLSQEQTMEVYIDNGTSNGISLGFVTFGTGVLTQNRSISFPVVDNNIALEPDKHYLLRLRNIGNIGLGNPGTMNVTVEDDDVINLFLERGLYDVTENQTSVEICVVLTGGILSTPINIYLFDSQLTAKYQFDYIFFNFHVILPPYKNSTCVTLYIVNDNIKETLYEVMYMYIFRVIPSNKNLHVDYTWSTVRIQDDE